MSRVLGTLGTVDTLKLGNLILTDLDNLKILGGYVTNSNNYTTFVNANSAASYQVPTGKKFVVSALSFRFFGEAPNNDVVLFGHSDTDGGINNAAPGTVTWPGNEDANALNFASGIYDTTNDKYVTDETNEYFITKLKGFELPAGSYPTAFFNTVRAGVQVNFTLYGYEVAV